MSPSIEGSISLSSIFYWYLAGVSLSSLEYCEDNDGIFDKEATSYIDIFDAFRLALKFYHFEGSR
jgi:hypothetical protein